MYCKRKNNSNSKLLSRLYGFFKLVTVLFVKCYTTVALRTIEYNIRNKTPFDRTDQGGIWVL